MIVEMKNLRNLLSKRTVISIFVSVTLLILLIVWNVHTRPAPSPTPRAIPIVYTVHIKDQLVRVSIADTEEKRELGLGGRAGLEKDEGMLFAFPKDGKYGFLRYVQFFPEQ